MMYAVDIPWYQYNETKFLKAFQIFHNKWISGFFWIYGYMLGTKRVTRESLVMLA